MEIIALFLPILFWDWLLGSHFFHPEACASKGTWIHRHIWPYQTKLLNISSVQQTSEDREKRVKRIVMSYFWNKNKNHINISNLDKLRTYLHLVLHNNHENSIVNIDVLEVHAAFFLLLSPDASVLNPPLRLSAVKKKHFPLVFC